MYIQEVYMAEQVKIITIRVTNNSGMINYCYLIVDIITKYCCLVDPAWDLKKIKELIVQNDLILKGVLLTHAHHDHVDLALDFSNLYNIPMWISKNEAYYYNFYHDNLQTFKDNQKIYLGSLLVETWITPGHTKGSSCFYINGHLLTGDTLFIEGCGECKSDGSNVNELYESLNRILQSCSDHTLIYPGHSFGKKPGVTFKYVKENNIYLQFKDAISFSKFRMRKQQVGLFNFK